MEFIRKLVFSFILLLLSITPAVVDAGEITADEDTTLADISLHWTFAASYGEKVTSSPAVDDSGVVYVGSEGRIYAVNRDGFVEWVFYLRGDGASPAVGPDNNIYFGDNAGYFYALDRNGNELWHTDVLRKKSDWISSVPVIGPDNTLYFTTERGYITALDQQGAVKWQFKAGWDSKDPQGVYVKSTPAISSDGTIYFGASDNYLYALTPYGTVKWRFRAEHFFDGSSPAIGAAGTIYICCHDERLYAVSPEGELEWTYNIEYPGSFSPTIDEDGTIYIGGYTEDGSGMFAFNPDGTKKWFVKTSGQAGVSPVIGSDGIIYFNNSYTVYAFGTDGSLQCNFSIEDKIGSYGGMSKDGVLYYTSETLYAFQTRSNGLKERAQWPQFSHQNRCLATGAPVIPDLHVVEGTVAVPDTIFADIDVIAGGLTSVTDSNGHFSFLLPDGEYTLLFDVEDPLCPPEVDVTVDGADVVVVMPSDQHTVSGRFLYDGSPVSDVTVEINNEKAVSDANGEFELDVYSGDYIMEISSPASCMPMKMPLRVSGADVSAGDFALSRISYVYNYEGNYWSSPALDPSGRLYTVDNGDAGECDILIIMDAEGTILHETELPERVLHYSVAPDGTIYLENNTSMFAVDSSGEFLWRYDVEDDVFGSSPVIGPDGTLYGTSYFTLYAINPDGTEKWTYTRGRYSWGSSQVIDSRGIIIVTYSSGYVYAYNPDGTVLWVYGEGLDVYGPPSIGADNTIYFGANDKHIYALNADGTLKWKYYTKHRLLGHPLVGSDGTIYISDMEDNLYAVDADGVLKWKIDSHIIQMIASDGTLICETPSGEIVGVSPDGTDLWWYKYPGYEFERCVLGPDGTLYVNAVNCEEEDYILLAVKTPFTGMSTDSPWPCRLKDASHTGYAGAGESTAVADDSGCENEAGTPLALKLYSAFPNPFNPRTTIAFSIPVTGQVKFSVYNIAGQEVATLVSGRVSAGKHQVVFDGSGISSGLYFYRLETGQEMRTGKMMLMK